MATTSIRTAAKAKLVDLLAGRPELAGVQVAYAEPVSNVEAEHVFLGGARGLVNIPTMRTGRKTRDDTFVQEIHFTAGKPDQTAEQADTRVEEMYGALENLLATDPSLENLDGLKWAIQNGEVEFFEPEAHAEGYVGYCTARIELKSRLT